MAIWKKIGTEILKKRGPRGQMAEMPPIRSGGVKRVGDLEVVILIARAEMTGNNFRIRAGNHRSLVPEA